MDLLINIDVPDLAKGVAFYGEAFGLVVARRLGSEVVELSGWPVKVYLLQNPGGSLGAAKDPRRYQRHWTPVHFDVVVENVEGCRKPRGRERREGRARDSNSSLGQDRGALRPVRPWLLPDPVSRARL